jgi:gluconolactonase
VRDPEPDVIALDKALAKYKIAMSPIERLHTGTYSAECPAWSGWGNHLAWRDLSNDVQLRWLQDDNQVTTFRKPANHGNGNTFDREGRQISFEHGTRRVVRYEPDNSVTVLAEKFNGKPFNAPNDGSELQSVGYRRNEAHERPRTRLDEDGPRRQGSRWTRRRHPMR